jgi:hypothetical protein
VAVTDPITLIVDDAFERVRVLANTLVVVRAFVEYKLLRERLERFAMDATLRVPTFATAAVKFVVKDARFAMDTTLIVPTFATLAVRLVVKDARFAMDTTLRIPTFATPAVKFVVKDARFATDTTLRVPTLAKEVITELAVRLVFKELRFEIVMAFRVATFRVEIEITEGKSALTSARNEGAPADPMDGPAKTWFGGAPTDVPVPPDEMAKGVPNVKLLMEAPSTTVRAYPGLEAV